MRRPRTFLALCLLLSSVAFAGCTGGGEVPDDGADDEPIFHTSPDDLDGLNASEARNRSHLHDYWNDQDRILVVDETISMRCNVCGAGAPAFRHEPPAGAVFPQGTRWVNVTLSWEVTDTSTFTEPRLWVETAADHEPWDAGAIEDGGTIQLEVTNGQNDLPHETLSNWAFELRVAPPVGGTVYSIEGAATLTVDAGRGHPIPVFPPHPDLWNGTTEILLFDDDDAAQPFYQGNPRDGQTGPNWLGPHVPDDGLVVPYDMDHVTVVVTFGPDAPFPFTLAFHGSGSREWTLLEPDETSDTGETYTIHPDEGRPDGPYAKQSQWIFEVFTDDEDPNVFVGSYSIQATVYKDP